MKTGNGNKRDMRYRLFLVNPKLKYPHYIAQRELSTLLNKRNFSVPLALPLIAALTPDHYDIRIIDEEMDPVPTDTKPDIVGITTLVSTISRAKEIASLYRSMGSVVVLGGSYATFMTEEVLKYADCVVVGEAEGLWQQLLADFEKGELKRVYQADSVPEFRKSPVPRWDLVDAENFLVLGVQVSRGCPYRCEFCLVNRMFGNRIRYRDIDDVINEIKSLPSRNYFFVDDNIAAKKSYAKELMKRLKPLGISWACQANLDVADDEELLEDMAEAGCFSILIGLESINPESLKETNKMHNNISRYDAAIRRIHAHGMYVSASFIVGFDSDTPEVFDHIYDFSSRNNLSFIVIGPLTAAPGTDLYERMKKEDRLLDIDPEYVNGVFPSMRYRNMSLTEMFDRYYETTDRLLRPDVVRRKALALFSGGTFMRKEGIDVGIVDKVSTFLTLLKKYLLSPDARKRKLFLDLVFIGHSGKVPMHKVVVYLLTYLGFEEYFKSAKSYLPGIREMLQQVEQNAAQQPPGRAPLSFRK
ncbi:MAG: radical SAM protein [Pseudomonadota bacterium]